MVHAVLNVCFSQQPNHDQYLGQMITQCYVFRFVGIQTCMHAGYHSIMVVPPSDNKA